MQTKAVLTILSLAMLFSSSAFGMLAPRAGGALLSRLAQRTTPQGRTSLKPALRQLPGKDAPRKFFSDNINKDQHSKKPPKGMLFGVFLTGFVGSYGWLLALHG